MKTLKCLSGILVFVLFAVCVKQVSATSQMVKWYFPGKSIDFKSNLAVPVIDTLPGGPTSGSTSNGICRGNGETMFYIIDGVPYDYLGNLIEPGYDISCDVIVPTAWMRAIVFGAGYEYGFSTEYKPHEPPYIWMLDQDIFYEDFPFSYDWVDAAVTKNPCGWWNLYVEKEKTIERWTLGYHYKKLNTINNKKTISSIGTFELENKYSEFEVSPNSRKLAGTIGEAGGYPRTVFVIDLDDYGDFERQSEYTLPLLYGYYYMCSGLEFSGNSKKLYASWHFPDSPASVNQTEAHSLDGIYWIDFTVEIPQWAGPITDSKDFAYSQLELARNGLIYAASKTNVLKGIDTTSDPPTFTSTIDGINVPTSYQYVWGWPKSVWDVQKRLPKQIDGYDYDDILFYWEKTFLIHDIIPAYCVGEILHWEKAKKKGKGLSWQCLNTMASSYDVYLGTDYNNVNNATIFDPCGIYKGRVVNNNYFAENLAFQKTYYWRVDAVNDVMPSTWKGDVWAFTTDDCILPLSNTTTWFAFDENSGIEAIDSGGVIFGQGTLTNGASFTSNGKVDGGLQLDGVDDYVDVYNDPELNFGTGDFSVDAWVKTSDTNGSNNILDKRSGTQPNPTGYLFFVYNGNLAFQLADGNYSNYNSTLVVANGNWHHVAATVNRDDPNGLKLYVDGVCQAFGPGDRQGSLDNDANLLIGGHSFILPGHFNGSIDEVDLFNREIDVNEVQAIFEAGSGGKYKKPKPVSNCKKADLNNDDIVNFEDFAIFADCWLVDCKQ